MQVDEENLQFHSNGSKIESGAMYAQDTPALCPVTFRFICPLHARLHLRYVNIMYYVRRLVYDNVACNHE